MAAPQEQLTYADYLSFPDDGLRRELIGGELFVTPAPNVRHQRIALRIARALADHVDAHGGGEVFIAPCDVVLSDSDVVEPDVFFVASAISGAVTEANVQGPPSLVIEVVSDPRTDRVRKRDLYARHGVLEYWVVDPEADRIEVYHPSGGAYTKPEIFEPEETLSTPLLPGLALDVASLLRR